MITSLVFQLTKPRHHAPLFGPLWVVRIRLEINDPLELEREALGANKPRRLTSTKISGLPRPEEQTAPEKNWGAPNRPGCLRIATPLNVKQSKKRRENRTPQQK
jgi:hypothetical protein